MMESETIKEPKICQICEQNPSKYLCPRCGVPYCSLPCYKSETKHLQCSESFYRECVMEEVRNEEVHNPENSKKMNEILQRFHEQYDGPIAVDTEEEGEDVLDSDDDEPLDKRLEGINLNNSEEVWKHLTENEKREFQNLVKNVEEASDIIPVWTPWWYDEPEKKLVVEISDTEDVSENLLKLSKRQPGILNKVPRMAELTKIKPNEHVAKGLLNVITAYVWTARLYNGDLLDTEKLIEIASSIICLSSYLSKNGLFKNVEHAVADVPMNACKVPALSEGGTAIQANLNQDVWIIVKGPKDVKPSVAKGYILSALTECYTVCLKAAKQLKINGHDIDSSSREKSENQGEKFSKLFPAPPPIVSADIKLLNNSKRKILYLIAFANEFMDSFQSIYQG